MYLEIFLADFTVFRVFWGISRVRDCAKYQKPCDDKNLQRRREFAGEHDFPIKTHTDQVYCSSHSRDQKFVTSLVQSAIGQ